MYRIGLIVSAGFSGSYRLDRIGIGIGFARRNWLLCAGWYEEIGLLLAGWDGWDGGGTGLGRGWDGGTDVSRRQNGNAAIGS